MLTASAIDVDTVSARRLFLLALDQEAALHMDSAIALLRASKQTAPVFYAAHREYIQLMRSAGRRAELEREYPLPASQALPACLAIEARKPSAYGALVAFDVLDARRRHGAHPCFDAALIGTASLHSPGPSTANLEDGYAIAAMKYAPEVAVHWTARADALRALGRTAEARTLLERALSAAPHPLARIPLYFHLIGLHEAVGDTTQGMQLRQVLHSAVVRDGRPGVEMRYLENLASHPGLHERRDEWLRRSHRMLLLARRARAWTVEHAVLLGRGSILLDAGQTNAAIAAFDSSMAAIPAGRAAELIPQLYWRRGRAYAKAGRLPEAERDLHRALDALAGGNEAYLIAELHHNLAHVYESAGRWPEAMEQADQFVTSSEPMRTDAMRMMSRRDAGLIRWKAGEHAAARTAFESMVRVIDQRQQNYFYAGEYFERIGEMQRAAHYYRLGAASDHGERSLNHAGRTRVFESLGMRDSARSAAESHDAHIQTPSETPLLPGVLAREGRVVEALELLRRWSATQRGQGNIAGETLTSLAIARILLEAGRSEGALLESERAARLAGSLQLTGEGIEAERLRGLAQSSLGRHAQALITLRRAARVARAHPASTTTIQVQLALGDVLRAAGNWRNALAAYTTAAAATDSASDSFEEDVDRARFRDRHLAPFDGAVRVLLPRAGSAQWADSLVTWSARRKTALLAGGRSLHRRKRGTISPPSARLSAHEAMLDYVVLDGRVSVLVVRRAGVQVVPLVAGIDSVARLIATLREPMLTTYAGRLDLARAHFNLNAAHALYRALIEPALPALEGVVSLVVVPDGALHYVPFDALVITAPAAASGERSYLRAEYVVDRYTITVASPIASAPDVHSAREISSVLVLARGAAGGSREAEAIRSGWRGQVRVLSEDGATERALWLEAPKHAILHFATHAKANDRDPLASYLALAAEDRNEGLLHSGEITRARWRGRLVVLSACETASGPLLAGEGMMSLARGFLAGGADAVVATLWPIGSSAAEMMGPLYESLSRGRTTAAALREAKLTLRRQEETAHPFFWASYQLISRRTGWAGHGRH